MRACGQTSNDTFNAQLLRRVWFQLLPDGDPLEVTTGAIFGRASDCALVVPGGSRQHVRVVVGAEVTAEDLGSSSGTRLRRAGQPERALQTREVLVHGDELVISDAVVRVSIDDDGQRSPALDPSLEPLEALRRRELEALRAKPGQVPPGVEVESAVFGADGALTKCRWIGATNPEHGAWQSVVELEAVCAARLTRAQTPFARRLPALERLLHVTESSVQHVRHAVLPRLQLLSLAIPLEALRVDQVLDLPRASTLCIEPELTPATRGRLSSLLGSLGGVLAQCAPKLRLRASNGDSVLRELRVSPLRVELEFEAPAK